MDFFKDTIEKLRVKRGLFHSEDDLKFAIALELTLNNPDLNIRLEKPENIVMLNRSGKEDRIRAPFDLMIISNDGSLIPVELKYKTKKLDYLDKNHEQYNLTEHGATDIGRYSFRKDIFRVENFIELNSNSTYGYVLILTCDKDYYSNDVSDKNKFDRHFTFHDGSTLPIADKSWNYDCIDTKKYIEDADAHLWTYIRKRKETLDLHKGTLLST